jgi:hypothetical protein
VVPGGCWDVCRGRPVLAAESADFLSNWCDLKILSEDHIRHAPWCISTPALILMNPDHCPPCCLFKMGERLRMPATDGTPGGLWLPSKSACSDLLFYLFLSSYSRHFQNKMPCTDSKQEYLQTKQTPWPQSVIELYRPWDRRLWAKLVPTFADRKCLAVSVMDPHDRILGFLDRTQIYLRIVKNTAYINTIQHIKKKINNN